MIYPLFKIKRYLFLLIHVFFFINICSAEIPQLTLKETPTHFFAGSNVKIEVMLENAPEIKTVPPLDWVLTAGEAIVLRGNTGGYVLDAIDERKPIIIDFNMPRVRRRTELVLSASANIKGTILQKTINLYAYPRGQLAELNNIFRYKSIGIYDPLDNLTKHVKITTPPEIAIFNGDLLLITEDVISESRKDITMAIEKKLEEGMPVIILKQSKPFKLGDFKISPWEVTTSINSIRELAKGHEIFSEIYPADLSSWQPDGIISTTSLKKLEKGNFRIFTDGNKNGGALIEELIVGKGRLILCQVPFIDRLNIEPVANMLLINLIRYALSVKPVEFKSLTISASSQTIEIMKKIGIQSNTSFGEKSILLIDIPKDENYQIDELFVNAYLKKGNTLLVTNLTEYALKYFKNIIPCKFELKELKSVPAQIRVDNENPLMWGISKEDIEETIKELEREETPMEYSLVFEEGDDCKNLISPGIIAKFKKDKGAIIISQIPFIETDNPAYLRTISQLFTNLGVRISLDE